MQLACILSQGGSTSGHSSGTLGHAVCSFVTPASVPKIRCLQPCVGPVQHVCSLQTLSFIVKGDRPGQASTSVVRSQTCAEELARRAGIPHHSSKTVAAPYGCCSTNHCAHTFGGTLHTYSLVAAVGKAQPSSTRCTVQLKPVAPNHEGEEQGDAQAQQ